MDSARKMAEEALAEIAAGDHGEYCGLRNGMLLAGGKTECYADCPKRVAAEALEALLAAWPEAKAPGHDRIAELESLLRECNAVCLCGCPDSEHEADECGESCGHDDHECIRVPKAVLAYVERLRSTPPPPSDAVREAAYQTGKAWASAEDDALKAHLGSRLRAHDAALREALDAAKGGPDA